MSYPTTSPTPSFWTRSRILFALLAVIVIGGGIWIEVFGPGDTTIVKKVFVPDGGTVLIDPNSPPPGNEKPGDPCGGNANKKLFEVLLHKRTKGIADKKSLISALKNIEGVVISEKTTMKEIMEIILAKPERLLNLRNAKNVGYKTYWSFVDLLKEQCTGNSQKIDEIAGSR